MLSRRHAALVAVWGIAACADSDPPMEQTVVDVGAIQFIDSKPVIDAPMTAVVGSAAVVSVTTIGSGCYSVDSTLVQPTADGGDLTPYDRHVVPGPHSACPAIELTLVHSGTFQFTSSGSKTITVHGAGDVAIPITIDVQ